MLFFREVFKLSNTFNMGLWLGRLRKNSPCFWLKINYLLSKFLTKLFCFRFTKAIQGLPFGQITSIWNIFCDEIVENYLAKISPSTEAGLVKKNKKSSPQSPALWRSLEHVTSIFSAFLVNISFGGIGEQLKRRTSMSSVGELLRRTVMNVVDPLFKMSSKVVRETVSDTC